MRFQCSFNLAPELHEPDSFAIDNLRKWQQAEKSRDDEVNVAQHRRTRFHKEIYLSGLYLYQLTPEFPRMLAEQYTLQGVSYKRLEKQLQALAPQDAAAMKPAQLDESQWQKLESMFARFGQSIDELAKNQAELDDEKDADKDEQAQTQMQPSEWQQLLEEHAQSQQSLLQQTLAEQEQQIIAKFEQSNTAQTQTICDAVKDSSLQVTEVVAKDLTEQCQQLVQANERHQQAQADEEDMRLLLTEQLSQLQQQQTSMLTQMNDMLTQQQQLSQALESVNASPELSADTSATTAEQTYQQLEQLQQLLRGKQNDLLEQVNVGQQQLLSSMNMLELQVRQLKQNANAEVAMPVADNPLQAQLSRASKIKAKGLW